MKYGIFGCTADPFTRAHYEIVRRVLVNKLVDKVIIIPTIVDYYRKDKERMFSNEQRLMIIKKWFEGQKDVFIDDYEYQLAATSKNYDIISNQFNDRIINRRYWHTLQDAMARYDSGCRHEFYTIIGGDSWNDLQKWFNWKELGNITKFIVIKRDEDTLNDYSEYAEYEHQPSHILTLDPEYIDISATKIRESLERSRDTLDNSQTILNTYLKQIEIIKQKNNYD